MSTARSSSCSRAGWSSRRRARATSRSSLLAAEGPEVRALGARLRNLGIHRWPIWSGGDEGSVQDLVAPGGPRALVVDLGSLGTAGEKAIAAESVLAALWRRRAEREPVLIVIDEAHNVCPREPGDEVTALATEHAARIAAEGRKFGLYLLVSTQRPHRVNELVVSQCDNLVLMRMTSAGDLAYVADTLSFAPPALLARGDVVPDGRVARRGEDRVASRVRPLRAAGLRGGRLGRARDLGGARVDVTDSSDRQRPARARPSCCSPWRPAQFLMTLDTSVKPLARRALGSFRVTAA